MKTGSCQSVFACGVQVEIRDGQLIGTLGRQTSSRQSAGKCSRLLSDLGPGTFFGSGALLNGEGDLQVPSANLADIDILNTTLSDELQDRALPNAILQA